MWVEQWASGPVGQWSRITTCSVKAPLKALITQNICRPNEWQNNQHMPAAICSVKESDFPQGSDPALYDDNGLTVGLHNFTAWV
jgi:hypothetical protein